MTRLDAVLAAIDATNAADPRRETADGAAVPVEWIYGRRMSDMLARHHPGADELLQIAVRAQHIRRWEIPRANYPMDRAGYHRWRTELKGLHARAAADIMRANGYTEDEIGRVSAIVAKQNLKGDAAAQTLEDMACLVFLAHYGAEFAAKHDAAKMDGILKKTWAKMSPGARAAALAMKLPPALGEAVTRALA